jgi:hypothetical protein
MRGQLVTLHAEATLVIRAVLDTFLGRQVYERAVGARAAGCRLCTKLLRTLFNEDDVQSAREDDAAEKQHDTPTLSYAQYKRSHIRLTYCRRCKCPCFPLRIHVNARSFRTFCTNL